MLALAVVEALQAEGLGTYGEDLWWDGSPVLQTGVVTDIEGVWCQTTGESVNEALVYTSRIDVTGRFMSQIEGSQRLYDIAHYVNRVLRHACELQLTIGQDTPLVFPINSIDPASLPQMIATDSEGRPIKQLSITIRHRLPEERK